MKKKGVAKRVQGFGQIKTLFNLGVIKSVVNRMEAKKYNYVDGSTFISHLLSWIDCRVDSEPLHFRSISLFIDWPRVTPLLHSFVIKQNNERDAAAAAAAD